MGVVAALAVVLIWVVVGTLQAPVVNAGDKAPDFALVTDEGHAITPSNFGGKLLVLNFWASWCPPCIEEEPSLAGVSARLRLEGRGGAGRERGPDRQKLSPIPGPFPGRLTTPGAIPDAEAGLAARYGTFQFPETYIIDSSGHVVIKIPDPQDFTDPEFMARIEKNL